MEFILIGLILIFIITYRNSSGEGVYKFVKDQAQVVYDQYAPYSYKVMREKIKELGLEYTPRHYSSSYLCRSCCSNRIFLFL